MKAGKAASLVLIVALTVLAALASGLAESSGSFPWARAHSTLWHSIFVASTVGLCFAIVLLPTGAALDRAIDKVRRFIEEADASEKSPPYDGPRWLAPVTGAFTGAVDTFRQREAKLRNQLRELEIRHRVSEAERRHIEAVLHSLRDAVLITDSFNEIVMANYPAAELLGFDLEKAIHRPIDQVIDDERLCRLIADAKETANVAERQHIEHDVVAARDTRGEPTDTRTVDVSLACVENHKHEVGGVVAIIHDLTNEREVSEMKSDFVSKASHELRTPLSSIRAYVEMLVDGEARDEEARREFYQIIQNETERLGRLIDNMLNISRIEAGIIQIEREDVDIKALIDLARETLEPQAQERNITLHVKLAPVGLCVEGDKDMLHQTVLNLVSNAVKYTPEGGRVTISADSDNLTRSVVVSVSDTGLGIPPDAIPKLFDKFYRVENYKRVAKGTGLGLSLCKHIVETVHRGQIGVESKLGMGSKFWFSIPMRYVGSHAAA
ncbi:MAG: PAS domain-containing protein [Phycisphaerales bacterium]|nr:MAG: PAS domain-containing protein [Phycisphaerales bacterium]